MAKKKAKPAKGKAAKKASAKAKPTKAAVKGKAKKLTPVKVGKVTKAGKKPAVATRSKARPAAVAQSVVHEFEIYAHALPRKIPENQMPNFYCAVEASSVSQLAFVVQSKINDGWIPTGGVTHSAGSFVQALIRY